MYITYKEQNYPCMKFKGIGGGVSYRGLPADFPAPVEGEMVLYADDGFKMRTERAENWLRQTFRGGILVFTNTPEPEPEPDTDEGDGEDDTTANERLSWDSLAAAYTEGVNNIDA